MNCCRSSSRRVSPEAGVAPGLAMGVKELKTEGDRMAREIVISHFKTVLKENPNATLDMAILSFENAGPEYENNLTEFAKTRTRTPEMYRASYETFFITAKETLE
jgi:hypothetical protein